MTWKWANNLNKMAKTKTDNSFKRTGKRERSPALQVRGSATHQPRSYAVDDVRMEPSGPAQLTHTLAIPNPERPHYQMMAIN